MTAENQPHEPSTADQIRGGYNKFFEGKHNVDRFSSQVTSTVNDVSNAYNTVSRLFGQCRDIWRTVSGRK